MYPLMMVDIETASSRSYAAILSIGAVIYDYAYPEVANPREHYRTFYINISLESCISHGLHVSGSTFYWWMSQSNEAREAIMNNTYPLSTALLEFYTFITKHFGSFQAMDKLRVYAWPPQFDLNRIREAAYACKKTNSEYPLKVPWHYRQERDMRTVMDLIGEEVKTPEQPEGTKHKALNDALAQMDCLCSALNTLNALKA